MAGAVLVRVLRFAGTSLMFNDGPVFLSLARVMSEGRFGEALAHAYHPLYPFLTMLAWQGVGDWESAAACVSVVSGAASVLFLFLFARDAFGAQAGWIAALALATQPRAVAWSADVQSDGLYLALFLGAVFFLWRSLRTGRALPAAAAGAFTGLAYLARPEGVGVGLAGLLLLAGFGARPSWPPSRRIGAAAALVGAALLVMAPYLVTLRLSHGAWVFSQKKGITQILGAEPEADAVALPPGGASSGTESASDWTLRRPEARGAAAAPPSGPFGAAWKVFLAASNALRPWGLALLLLGVALRFGRPGPTGTFVGLLVGLYAVVLLRQALRFGYVDARHALPPLVPAFGYLAIAVPVVAGGLLRALGRPFGWAAASARQAAIVGCLVVAAAGLGQVLRPERPGARADRQAAEWLRAQALPEGAVAATKGRLAFYADRPYVSLHGGPPEGLLAHLRGRGARFVIVDDERLKELPELEAARGSTLRLLTRIEDRGRATSVYELTGGP